VPQEQDLDLEGIQGFGSEQFQEAMSIHRDEWPYEVLLQEELPEQLYDPCPRSSSTCASCC
jgi:GTP-dependent phosphoenolpyruvate carboxykinase